MPSSYSDAARSARDRGVIDRHSVQQWQVRADLQNYLNVQNPSSGGGRKLLDETTREAMDQRVRGDDGEYVGRRRDLKTWEDRWGNIMARNERTEKTRKLLDSEDRGL